MLAQEKKHLTELLAKIPTKRHKKVVRWKKSVGEIVGDAAENGALELRIVANVRLIHKLEYIAAEFGADLVEELEVTAIPAELVEEEFAVNPAGTILQGVRFREGITQVDLSRNTGIPQRHISEMENGKRTIGKVNARKLAKAMDVDYRIFL
jgi:hypothetical protein